jgi:hypothetical protein
MTNPPAVQTVKDLHAPGEVPDGYVVVRGGSGDLPPARIVFSGAAGVDAIDAGKGIPHGTLRITTAGAIRAAGGIVEAAPERSRSGKINGRHVNIMLGGKRQPFGPPQQNPNPKVDRIR